MSTTLEDVTQTQRRQLLDFCQAEREWAEQLTVELVRLESPTTDKTAVDRCGETLGRRMEEMGGLVTRVAQTSAGDHLRAEFGAGSATLMLLGHFDTVWPVGQVERMPIEVRDGCLFGPGVLDMKAGIVVALQAVRALAALEALDFRVVMLWTTDEECGSVTSRRLIEEEARGCDAVFVLEPAMVGGGVKTRRKGCGEYRLVVHGKAAHAGVEPDRGASAVHELAAQVVDLQRVREVASGVSFNVGVMSGGSRPNVVAERAEATLDIRVHTAADARLVDEIVQHREPTIPGTRIELTGGFDRPPLERTDAVVRLYERARAIASTLGHDLAEGGTGGGSDGNFTAAVGVPTLDGVGPLGAGPHALHEHVELASLPWRAAMLAALMSETAGG